MKVSIIIPCYNTASTIIEAVESALHQSFKNTEIIVVDDGSVDNTVDLIKGLYPQIQIIKQENSGPSKARNTGANIATGDFFVFLDSDDKLHPSYIQKCLNAYTENPKLEIVYADVAFFGAQSGLFILEDYNYSTFLFNNCIPIFAMIKKETFFKIGGFDNEIKYAEDWDLWLRIVMAGGEVKKIKETLYYYRKRHDASSLTDKNEIMNNFDDSKLIIYIKYYEAYKAQNLSITNLYNAYAISFHNDFKIAFNKLHQKYYNVWYRKLIYKIFKPKKYKKIYK